MPRLRQALRWAGVVLLTLPACQCPTSCSSQQPQPEARRSTRRLLAQRSTGWHAQGDGATGVDGLAARRDVPEARPSPSPPSKRQVPSLALAVDPAGGAAPLDVELTAEVANAKAGMVLSWDFGDGTQAVGSILQRHRYESPGEYTATVRVQWSDKVQQQTAHIKVDENAFDVAVSADPESGPAPLRVQLEAAPSSAEFSSGYEYRWDLGDGTRQFGPIVSAVYSRPGTYKVTVRVTDVKGEQGRGDAEIEVDPPD